MFDSIIDKVASEVRTLLDEYRVEILELKAVLVQTNETLNKVVVVMDKLVEQNEKKNEIVQLP